MKITKKEQVADMYISWRMFMEEGLRRGYIFEKVFEKKPYYFRAEKGDVGFCYDFLPGFLSVKQRDDYPALEKKSVETEMMRAAGLPTPDFYGSFAEVADVPFETLTYPVVVKPERSIQSKNAFVDLKSAEELTTAIEKIKADTPEKGFVVEQMVNGNEYRIVVVNGKYCCAIQRRAASVTGDGVHTVEELVAERNAEDGRGPADSLLHTVHPLVLDAVSDELLAAQNLARSSVVPKGSVITIQKKVNAAIGTDYVDCTDRVHKDFAAMCERFCVDQDFFIIGFDLICPDVSAAPATQEHAFNEFNFRPCIDLNENCNFGTRQPFSARIWDALEARADELLTPDFKEF